MGAQLGWKNEKNIPEEGTKNYNLAEYYPENIELIGEKMWTIYFRALIPRYT